MSFLKVDTRKTRSNSGQLTKVAMDPVDNPVITMDADGSFAMDVTMNIRWSRSWTCLFPRFRKEL